LLRGGLRRGPVIRGASRLAALLRSSSRTYGRGHNFTLPLSSVSSSTWTRIITSGFFFPQSTNALPIRAQSAGTEQIKELIMDEDVFNTSIRKFLKSLGVTAQREIERAVRQALAEHRLKGDETLPARATVSIGQLKFTLEIDGQIALG
jgi:hypothetical protein